MSLAYTEKRDHYRMTVEHELQFRPESSPEFYVGYCQNLSTGGISFRSDEFIATGTRLEISLTPAKTLVPPLQATVEVLRAVPDAGAYRIAGKIKEIR